MSVKTHSWWKSGLTPLCMMRRRSLRLPSAGSKVTPISETPGQAWSRAVGRADKAMFAGVVDGHGMHKGRARPTDAEAV